MYDGPVPLSPFEPPGPASDPIVRCVGQRIADRRTAHVFAFVCRKVERIGREVGFPLAVIAATSDPERHATRLSVTRHAGWSPRTPAEWFMLFDDGLTLPGDLECR